MGISDDYDQDQAAAALGLDAEDWQRLARASTIASAPEAEGGRWSRHQILTLDRLYRHRWDRDGWPIGAVKAAERLAWRLDRATDAVTDEHVLALVDAGHLSACDEYKGHPLYSRAALDALDETVVDTVIDAQAAWREASLPSRDAAALLGWTETELQKAAEWARTMLRPGHAVIVDTETNGLHGELLQLAVLDAATGETLLDTHVNPGLLTWDETAQDIHGIGPDDVAAAPAWAELHHTFLDAVAGRVIVAYNADYDRPVIRAAAARAKLDLGAAGDRKTWACAMQAYTDWLETWGWMPLGGNHNALGDCQATRALLETMTRPHWAATPEQRIDRTDDAGARL